jgi:hypothetical protein
MSVSATFFGTTAQAVPQGGLNLTSLSINAEEIYGFGGPSGRPTGEVRFTDDGILQKAEYVSGDPISFVTISNEWWDGVVAPSGADYEVYWDTVTGGASGAASTWTTFGNAALDSWFDLSVDSTFRLQKNTTADGTSSWLVYAEIREIANPSNTSGPQPFTFSLVIEP